MLLTSLALVAAPVPTAPFAGGTEARTFSEASWSQLLAGSDINCGTDHLKRLMHTEVGTLVFDAHRNSYDPAYAFASTDVAYILGIEDTAKKTTLTPKTVIVLDGDARTISHSGRLCVLKLFLDSALPEGGGFLCELMQRVHRVCGRRSGPSRRSVRPTRWPGRCAESPDQQSAVSSHIGGCVEPGVKYKSYFSIPPLGGGVVLGVRCREYLTCSAVCLLGPFHMGEMIRSVTYTTPVHGVPYSSAIRLLGTNASITSNNSAPSIACEPSLSALVIAARSEIPVSE